MLEKWYLWDGVRSVSGVTSVLVVGLEYPDGDVMSFDQYLWSRNFNPLLSARVKAYTLGELVESKRAKKKSTLEFIVDDIISDSKNRGGTINSLKVTESDFLELYGNGLIKNQQVKDGQYSGIYKGVKIEARA